MTSRQDPARTPPDKRRSLESSEGPGLGREELLTRTFVDLADTLVDDYDVIDSLELLGHRCVDILGIEEAGVVLDDQRGQLEVLGSSSQRMRMVQLLELEVEEGPCLDSFRSGAPVRADELEATKQRWPRFGPSALEAGFRSVYALPMRLRGECIGALNLFANRPGALVRSDEVPAQALADVATIGILQRLFLHEHQVLTEQLQTALDTRVVIEQAKGMVAEQAKTEIDGAFELIRSYARDNNIALASVARKVVEGRLDAAALRRRRDGSAR